MASDIKQKFANKAAFGLTIASLTNNSARQSDRLDNSANLYRDALVFLKIKSAAASTAATGYVNVYAYASADDGTTQSENAGASDAAITLTSPPNVRLIGVINVVANSTTYYSNVMSVAAAFGGTLPKYWGIIIENKTGATLDATGGNHDAEWTGVYDQAA